MHSEDGDGQGYGVCMYAMWEHQKWECGGIVGERVEMDGGGPSGLEQEQEASAGGSGLVRLSNSRTGSLFFYEGECSLSVSVAQAGHGWSWTGVAFSRDGVWDLDAMLCCCSARCSCSNAGDAGKTTLGHNWARQGTAQQQANAQPPTHG